MTDFSTFRFGGASYPLTASVANSSLKDADPSIYYALDYLGSMIEHYAGARIVAEMAKVGLKDAKGSPYTSAVGHKIGYDPGPYLTREQVRFPLLSLYRVSDTFNEHTAIWRRESCDCTLLYVLPPLSPAQAERLMPLLKAVNAVVSYQIEQGMSPEYTPPGGALGGGAWAASGLMQVQMMSSRWTGFEAAEGELFFPTWAANIQIVERTDWIPSDYENYAGSDVQIDLDAPPPDTDVINFVDIATDVG